MLIHELPRPIIRRRSSCPVNSAFHLANLEETKSKIRVLGFPPSAFKFVLPRCVEFKPERMKEATDFPVIAAGGAIAASPSVVSIDSKSRVPECVVFEVPKSALGAVMVDAVATEYAEAIELTVTAVAPAHIGVLSTA